MSSINLLYIDLFCGAGGTSTGVESARIDGKQCAKVIACVNHDANAIASHAANHPDALHFTEDIRTLELSPLIEHLAKCKAQYPGAAVVLWASLECTNFSKAKGGQPRDADSRTLAEHLFRYIEAICPDYIQIEKIVSMGVRVDFNQGLDARLVTDDIARLLARVKWMKRIRFGCDTPGQIAECERATALIDKYGYKGEYFFYCILLSDFKESFERVNHWKNKGGRFLPHCQPYRDLNNPRQIIPQWQKDLAGWADKKWVFRSCEFKDFTPRKGFKCREYFQK